MYRAGSRVGNATSNTWIYSGLTCGTSYTLGVDAVDAAGNRSSQAAVMVSTTACSDTQAPTAPAGLSASNVTQTGAALAWTPSTDNVGVTGYDVYRNGAKVATVTSPSSSQSGLTCGTSYTYGVVASDAAGNRSAQTQLVSSTAACSAPPPPAPAPSGGTISSSECNSRAAVSGAVLDGVTVTGGCTINAANVTIRNSTLSGMVDIRPNASGSKLLNSQSMGFGLKGADNVLIEGNVFDGQGQVDNNEIYDEPSGNTPDGFVIRNNTFKNFYVNDGSTHSEAMFIGYSNNGLIEGNTFTNNGNTGHIFFTWWGGVANPSTSYPRNMCVRNNTFNATWDAYYDVNFRAEIPTSANIKIQSSASSTSPQFYASC
jgi:chitodextrinase